MFDNQVIDTWRLKIANENHGRGIALFTFNTRKVIYYLFIYLFMNSSFKNYLTISKNKNKKKQQSLLLYSPVSPVTSVEYS